MKKLFTLSSLILGIGLIQMSYSQSVNFKVYGGYSWPGFFKTSGIKGFQPGSNPEPTAASIVDMMNIVDTGATNKSYQAIRGSYGKGGNIGISVGYMFNKWIGVEMNMVYLFGSSIQSTQVSNASALLGPGAITRTKTSANGLSLLPAINLVAAVDNWKVLPYARLGISVPVYGSIKHVIDIEAPKPNAAFFATAKSIKSHVEVKTDATISLGFIGAIGATYQVHKNIRIFAEVNAQVLDVRAKKTTVEAYSITQTDVNGVESDYLTLDNFPNTYSREVVFVDELTDKSNNANYNTTYNSSGYNYDKDKPKDELRPTAPFHNIGLSVGLNFMISTAKKSKTTAN